MPKCAFCGKELKFDMSQPASTYLIECPDCHKVTVFRKEAM